MRTSYDRIVAPLLLISLGWIACEKEELPVAPHTPGDVQSATINMAQDYRFQTYFDLESGEVVKEVLKTDWDIAFETTPEGWHIILNSSKNMLAAPAGSSVFKEVTKTEGLTWQWDSPNGDLDSTAIGDWRDTEEVYVIDRGYSYTGKQVGYRKILFQSHNENTYTFRYAQLDGSGDTSITIKKDTTVNFVCFSFEDGGRKVDIEPPKQSWDLLFTQYIEVFNEDGMVIPYLVTGVLTNPHKVLAGIDTTVGFESFTYPDISEVTLTTDADAIGYGWKTYNFDSGEYDTHSELNYIIKDIEGFHYKLHFIDFYNKAGEKGHPLFEYQQL